MREKKLVFRKPVLWPAMHFLTVPKYEREKINTIKAFLGLVCELLQFNFILILLKFGYYACGFFCGMVPGLFPMSRLTLLVISTSGCRCALRREMVARCIKKQTHPALLPPVFVLHTK